MRIPGFTAVGSLAKAGTYGRVIMKAGATAGDLRLASRVQLTPSRCPIGCVPIAEIVCVELFGKLFCVRVPKCECRLDPVLSNHTGTL
jgi:hypothetical protein